MKKFIILLLLLTTSAWATTGTLKQVDSIQNSTGGSALSVPGTGSTFATDTNTLTLSGKTLTSPTINGGALSGTFTGAPTLSGALSLSGGPALSGAGSITSAFSLVDSSDATKKLQFSLSGMTASRTLTISTSQSTNQTLTVPDVGSGDSVATLNATQTFGSGSTWNGQPIGAAYGGASYVVNNSVASPQSVSAAGGISLSTPGFFNQVFAKGNTGSSTITVTATPSITACTASGQQLQIHSASATDLFTLQNNADLAGSAILLNGPWTSGMNNSSPYVLNLQCNTALKWVEVSRNN